ncbi:type VII secretion-associated protein [Nocardia sp. BMG51109]|uniref:type VII secretion-associated protein n=1 Tax=Nocardia sp. BMG51109 TaxID=1056816 RepID=UPI0012EB5361|nr:type VII secretion-associated protein [Nocardia sp. BMG51109]
MSTVELVLTDTRLWARSETTYWNGPPSIVPASDGASFVVGEALRPQYPAVSVVRFAEADRIAYPTMPTAADAFAVLLGAVLTNLRLPGPCERLTVLAPSEWGRRRRAAVRAAATRLAAEVTVEPLALRAVALGASTAQGQRIAVLEPNPLTTTVTLVGRSGARLWIDACEYEPAVGLTDAGDGPGLAAIAAVVARLLAGQTPTYLLAVGISEPHLLEGLRAAITAQCGFPVDVRPVAGADLIRGAQVPAALPQPGPPAGRAIEPPPDREASLREHAIAARPPRRRAPMLLLGAAVVVLAVVVGVAVLLTRSPDDTAADTRAATSAPAATPDARAVTRTFGRVRVPVPGGWHVASRSDARADLMPDDGARRRITLAQTDLTPGAGIDDVARTLESQMRRRPTGTVTDLHRTSDPNGRPGLSYDEYPPDGTTVRWQVVVDSGLQVSVGCQYPSGDWQPMAGPCAQVANDLRITPQ